MEESWNLDRKHTTMSSLQDASKDISDNPRQHMSESKMVQETMPDLTGIDVSDFDFHDLPPEFLAQKWFKLLAKNKELEAALKEIENKVRTLEARNVELEAEMNQRESVRLSHLELLSLRNTELEQQLHGAGVKPSEDRPLPAATAWASWGNKNSRPPLRGLRPPAADNTRLLTAKKDLEQKSPPSAKEGGLPS